MRKVGLLVIAALALFAFSGSGAYAQSTGPANTHTLTVTMNAQNGSGESGTATLTDNNGQLMVSLNLSNGPTEPQPAHIHKGSCANLDPKPLYPLTNVVNGKSDSALTIGMATMEGGQFAINIHKSAAEVTTYVSCGDIVNMQMSGGGASAGGAGTTSGGTNNTAPGMPNTGNSSDQALLVALTLLALAMTGVGLGLARRKA